LTSGEQYAGAEDRALRGHGPITLLRAPRNDLPRSQFPLALHILDSLPLHARTVLSHLPPGPGQKHRKGLTGTFDGENKRRFCQRMARVSWRCMYVLRLRIGRPDVLELCVLNVMKQLQLRLALW
jgi:hypothetical protein